MSPGKEQGPGREEASDLASKCLPCREGCPFCRDDTPCTVQEDGALRLAVASFQGLCMVLDLASMVAVYHFRRNKVRGEGGLEPIHLRLEPTGDPSELSGLRKFTVGTGAIIRFGFSRSQKIS